MSDTEPEATHIEQNINHEDIEAVFGVPRFPTWHLGLADAYSDEFYIMHSQECIDTNASVLECEFSHVLANDGISDSYWYERRGVPYFIILSPDTNRIIPVWVAGLTELGRSAPDVEVLPEVPNEDERGSDD